MEGYADGSWTPARQLYAVAALIAPAQAWAALQTPWSQVLRRADPKLEIFHRADLYSPYVEPYCRWDDAKRARVLAELTRLLAGTAKYAVAGVLLKDEYDSFCGRHGRPLGVTPYELCADTCIGFVSKWLEANDLGSERVAYFSEAGDREHGGSGQFSDSIQRIIRRSARYREEMRIASASFVSKRDAPALQTADLLAYEFTHCRPDIGEPTETLRTLAPTFPIHPVYLHGELLEDLASRYTDAVEKQVRKDYTLWRPHRKRRNLSEPPNSP
jgi:hypothetical protein